MSGHSHWSTIKHKKGAADAQRSKTFSKIARIISVAAREAGGNPDTNSKLRIAIDQARAINMPSDNIERAVQRGTGELEGAQLENILYEAYGPGGTALIIEGITDNKNRALGEIKQILNQHKGKLAGEGSVRWMFEQKGCVTVDSATPENRESLELAAIEAGADDIRWEESGMNIYTRPENLEKTKRNLEDKGIVAASASLDWVAKENVRVDAQTEQAMEKLFEALDESDVVQEIYSNIKD